MSLSRSRWPRKRSHGPAGDMWSVVHLPFALTQHLRALKVVAVPPSERREHLQARRVRVDVDDDGAAIVSGRLVAEAAPGEPVRRHLRRFAGRVEAERLAVCAGECVGEWVEREASGKGERRHDLRACDEVHRGGVGVVAGREVAIERRYDGVDVAGADGGALPLADAGAAGVRHYARADGFESGHLPVALDRGVDGLRSGGDEEIDRCGDAVLGGLAGDVRGAGDVLVG